MAIYYKEPGKNRGQCHSEAAYIISRFAIRVIAANGLRSAGQVTKRAIKGKEKRRIGII